METNKKFDVAVIGAGPAGAMAAQYAAKGGCRVALIERKRKVGIPVRCGEAVGLKGFSTSMDIEDKWILASVRKIRMISPGGIKVDLVNPAKTGKNYIIKREIMDEDLVRRAVKAGAEYFPSTPILSVKQESNRLYNCVGLQREFSASCVILADGVESRLARDLGWRTSLSMDDIESCAFCRVEHESITGDTIEFNVGNKVAPGGFAWVFPRGEKRANVGLGVLGSNSSGGKARELLDSFINKNFAGAVISDLHCGGAPVGKWLNPLVKNGIMIVGDAARQVNSLTGGGIAYALYAGRTAGETAAGAMKNGHLNYRYLKQYQKRWAHYCGKQQLRSYALKTVLLKKNNDNFFDTVARSLSRESPETLSYRRVFFRTFSKHPVILLKTFFLFR